MDAPSTIPGPGEIFEGRFRIDGVLGEGGMGVVLRATHLLTETPVAIKMLHPALAGHPHCAARFLREARNAAAVRGEHVGRVLDVGRTPNGLPYIVMEFLPGVDLSVFCAQKKTLTIMESATYMLQACVAMAEAHALGIVHRDLKPSNMFLTTREDGAPLVKVFDFGISKRSADDREDTQTLTDTGIALGTPHYMAPEQIADAKNVDERADIWALGAIIYEMLAGQFAFDGDSAAAIMVAVAAARPTPLQKLRPDVPAALAALVHRCLDKDPARRPADVVELARGLAPYASEAYRPLVHRIADTRRRPAPTGTKTPAEAVELFRRALENAKTVSLAHEPSPTVKKRRAELEKPRPASAAAKTGGRRTELWRVYIAVMVTITTVLAGLGLRETLAAHDAANLPPPPALPAKAEPGADSPPLPATAREPPEPAAAAPLAVPSNTAAAPESVATGAPRPGATGVTSRRTPAPGSTAQRKELHEDFAQEP